MYPLSQNNELLQIPVGNSTGSLPDLTLVHFQQSPISNPIDPHDQLIAVTSSYTTVSLLMGFNQGLDTFNFSRGVSRDKRFKKFKLGI